MEKSTEFGNWSLKEIIDGRYFRVPDYQRGYAWTGRQLEEFWEDLCSVIRSGGRHYTGAITAEALPGPAEIASRKGFDVVDGQQRLTTIAILFSALKLDVNPFLLKDGGEIRYVFSYGRNNDDYQFLCDVLSGAEVNDLKNSHQRNLKNARDFFAAKVGGADGAERLKIAEALMSRLAFDFRIFGAEYNSGIIFETMNNRGKPLSLLEKLKNRLMYLASTLPSDGDAESDGTFEDDKARLREDINEAWGEIYRRLASNPGKEPLDEDEFVAAHLSVYRAPKESVYSKAVAEARLFKMFCVDAERHPKSERVVEDDARAVARAEKEGRVDIGKIRDYVEDIRSFAEPWSRMHEDHASALGRCRMLSGALEVKIFLAAVLLHAGEGETAQSILENAEKILFRNTFRSVMDEATFATLARQLHGKCLDMLRRGDGEPIDAQGVRESLQAIVDDERRQIDIENLVDYFGALMDRQQSPYGFYGWPGLKYFLFKQEGDDGLGWNRFDEATLEHVMPQSAAADNDDGWWTRQIRDYAVASGFGGQNGLSDLERRSLRQCKRNLINSLGNFVLLTQSENASVSDDPWEGYPAVNGAHGEVVGKKAFYADAGHESSAGARRIAETDGSWNAFRIRERGRRLFRQLVEALGIAADVDDERVDLAIGFGAVKTLDDIAYPALPNDDVNRLAPKIGSAAETSREPRRDENANEANVAFWNAFKEWCSDNWMIWCDGPVAPRGNPYYDPHRRGESEDCHLFFTIGYRSGNVRGQGPLVTIGIYCSGGEEQRNRIRAYSSRFDDEFRDRPFDFQDWTSGDGRDRRIVFVRRADFRNPTPELFARMADDYERVHRVLSGILVRRSAAEFFPEDEEAALDEV